MRRSPLFYVFNTAIVTLIAGLVALLPLLYGLITDE